MDKGGIVDWKYQSGIIQLVYLADINYRVCKIIYDRLVKPDHVNSHQSGSEFMILSANNAFNEAISIIHTLLCSIKKEELRIHPYLEQVLDQEKAFVSILDEATINRFVNNIRADYPNADWFDRKYQVFVKENGQHVGDTLAYLRKSARHQTGLSALTDLKSKFEGYNFHRIRHTTVGHKNKKLDAPAGSSHLLLRKELIEQLGEVVRELKIHNHLWFNYTLDNPNEEVISSLRNILDGLTR